MKTILLLIFTLGFAGLCKSQQTKEMTMDSLGTYLRGNWKFDSVVGQILSFQYLTNDENSMTTNHKSIYAWLNDTIAKTKGDKLTLVPKSFIDAISGNPGAPRENIYFLQKDHSIPLLRYEILGLTNSTMTLVDLRKSSRKHPVSYKLSKLK